MQIFKKINVLVALLCIFLIASCGNQKIYTIEDMDLPQDFQLPDSVAQNMDDAIIPWNEFFKDTVLVNLIGKAFEQNFDIREANKEIAINQQYFKQSKMGFLPSFNLNLLNIEREWRSKFSDSSPETAWYDGNSKTAPENLFVSGSTFSTTAALDWEIDIWGKFRKKKKAALAYYMQSFELRKALQTEVVATVAEDYYTLLMLDEQLEVAKKNYHLRDSTLEMIQLLYTAGEVTASAVYQSKYQVLEAAQLIPELEKKREIQENKLRLLTGSLPDSIIRNATLTTLNTSYDRVKELPLYLVQNRPDVLISRYELKAANAKVGVAQVSRYPNLTISLEGGVESVLGENWFNVPGALLGGIIGGITAPIFNGRELKTAFEVAKLKRDQAEIGFQYKVYSAIVDIKNSLIAIEKLDEKLEIAKEQQVVSHKAVESSRMLFRSGYATYLEVITAQSDALETELNLVRAKTSLVVQHIQLYRALGGGWQ